MQDKFPKEAWKRIKGNIEGWHLELHHLIKGQKIERLELILPLSVEEHRGKNAAKNWADPDRVPQELRDRALDFWKTTLDEDDYEWFEENNLLYFTKDGNVQA